jgi:ankyrin repeat protein
MNDQIVYNNSSVIEDILLQEQEQESDNTKYNKIITKCLKSYLIGKKNINNNDEKSFEYFKQCIKILNDIKENNIIIDEKYNNIIEETETECCKYLTNTIHKKIEEPINNINNNNNLELFELIEIGNINELKKYNYGDINFKIYNEYGLTPLHYAIKYGDTGILKYFLKIGANIDETTNYGHTLLEYACLEKDPNMITFLSNHGADMKKHLLFRENKLFNNKSDQIDYALLQKIILNNDNNNLLNYKIKYLDFIFKYFDSNKYIDIEYTKNNEKINFEIFIINLDYLLDSFDNISRNTFIDIISEELNYNLISKLGCPNNKLQILLYNLVPFINYNNLRLNWLISIEIKYLILKILKNNKKINTKQFKNELFENLFNSYIKNNLIPDELIQIIVSQWIYKIKV